MKLITDEEELVSEVCEAVEIKESISTSIAHISQTISTLSELRTPPDTSATQSPCHNSQTIHTPPETVESPPISDIASSEGIPPNPNHDFTCLLKLNIPTFAGDILQ